MSACSPASFAADCPSRVLFEQIADEWSMIVLTVLDDGPLRFNAVRRQLDGVTQKALTGCPCRLERNGLVAQRVIPVSPVAVEYATTQLGQTLQLPFKALYGWTMAHLPKVEAARRVFDAGRWRRSRPERFKVSLKPVRQGHRKSFSKFRPAIWGTDR